MKRGKRARGRKSSPKHSLNLPELDQAKSAVLNSRQSKGIPARLPALDRRIHCLYCSDPRLSFNKAVVTRYRIHLESRQLAPGTINGRLAAVRRLAYESADSGLLSPDLAAGIRRVEGPKNLGVRLNWLTADQARALWQVPDANTLKGKRDRALLGVLLGCGLRRKEAAELDVAHLQRREDHWAIIDLVGKGRHIRTVPVPDWVKSAIDSWLVSAEISERTALFRILLGQVSHARKARKATLDSGIAQAYHPWYVYRRRST